MKFIPNLTVSLWKLKALVWIAIVFFAFCALIFSVSGMFIASVLFIFLILFSVPDLLQAGSIWSDSRKLSMRSPLGEFEIKWKEIEQVERGECHIIFIAGDKRFSIPTPGWWSGADSNELANAIFELLDERCIDIKYSFLADFGFSRNTRKA